MMPHAFHRRFEDAFDTGIRTFPLPYLLFASSGVFQLEYEDKTWLLPPHRAALIGANEPIRVFTTGPAISASVLLPRDGTYLPPSACTVFRITPLMREMVRHAMRWNDPGGSGDPMALPFLRILGYLAEDAARVPEHLWLPRPSSDECARAVAYTLEHLAEDVRFGDVAAAAFASERTLQRRFAEELGMRWTEYVTRARLIRATGMLLDSSRTVADIAYQVGFTSASKFSLAFRQLTGETPSGFRIQHVAKAIDE